MRKTALIIISILIGVASGSFAADNLTLFVAGDMVSFNGTITYPGKGTSSSFSEKTPYEMSVENSNCIISITNTTGGPLSAAIMKDNRVVKSAISKGEMSSLAIRYSANEKPTTDFRFASWGQSYDFVKEREVLATLDKDIQDPNVKGLSEIQYIGLWYGYNNIKVTYSFLDDKFVLGAYQMSFPVIEADGVEDKSAYEDAMKDISAYVNSLYGKSVSIKGLQEGTREWKAQFGYIAISSRKTKNDEEQPEYLIMIMYSKTHISDLFNELEKREVKK